jgi:hypothetical protein
MRYEVIDQLIGGAYGEMTVTMQYLFQGWNCRVRAAGSDEPVRELVSFVTIACSGSSTIGQTWCRVQPAVRGAALRAHVFLDCLE